MGVIWTLSRISFSIHLVLEWNNSVYSIEGVNAANRACIFSFNTIGKYKAEEWTKRCYDVKVRLQMALVGKRAGALLYAL